MVKLCMICGNVEGVDGISVHGYLYNIYVLYYNTVILYYTMIVLVFQQMSIGIVNG